MIRTKHSIYNTFASIISLMLPSLLTLILTKLIIAEFGSDINGVFVTINQIVSLLVLLEGGFTLATNVALFKPYISKDYERANSILSATRNAFVIIGLIYGIISIFVAIFLPYFIKSNLSSLIIIQLMLLASVNTLYSFFFEYRYRILFQTAQKEYIIMILNAITSCMGYFLAIMSIKVGFNIIAVRVALIIPVIIKAPILLSLHKKHFPWVDFRVKPDYRAINGTIDVFLQKLSDMLFFNTPVIVISSMSGTIYGSVYAIYNSIYSLIRNVTYSFVMAPYNGFGQLISQNGKFSIVRLFHVYQLIVNMISTTLLTTTTILIIPFIKLYTKGVTDVVYVDNVIALLFLASGLLEIMHISSRGILNISGNFKFMKKIVTIAAGINLLSSLVLTSYIGMYGAITGTIIGYVVLMPVTVYYAHIKYLECGLRDFLKVTLPNICASIIMVILFLNININFDNYLKFFLNSSIILLIVATFILMVNALINKSLLVEAFNKLKSMKSVKRFKI